MARTVAIGIQDFGQIIRGNCFYVDKTGFIKEWWEHRDSVTLITGITRISKESMFSDLNNLEVVSTTSEKYESAFGFTEQEVFAAMDAARSRRGDKKAVGAPRAKRKYRMCHR